MGEIYSAPIFVNTSKVCHILNTYLDGVPDCLELNDAFHRQEHTVLATAFARPCKDVKHDCNVNEVPRAENFVVTSSDLVIAVLVR